MRAAKMTTQAVRKLDALECELAAKRLNLQPTLGGQAGEPAALKRTSSATFGLETISGVLFPQIPNGLAGVRE